MLRAAASCCHLDWLQLAVSSVWVDALRAVVPCCYWVRVDGSRLFAAFSPDGVWPWQDGNMLMADTAEEVELKITK